MSKKSTEAPKGGRTGRPRERKEGAAKLMVYLLPSLYDDLGAASYKSGEPMTRIVEGLIEKWAAENRKMLDEVKKAKAPRGA